MIEIKVKCECCLRIVSAEEVINNNKILFIKPHKSDTINSENCERGFYQVQEWTKKIEELKKRLEKEKTKFNEERAKRKNQCPNCGKVLYY